MAELRGTSSQGVEVRELRLAVVLYGGASLAIYMHGVTRELHALVRASRLREAGVPAAGPSSSEAAYRDLLATIAATPGTAELRVVVDIVAGTSAGGINGIFLSKALAHDRSLRGLRDLWLSNGDIGKLLRGPEALPVGARFLLLVPQLPEQAPLHGDKPAQWYYQAFDDMDAEPPSVDRLGTLLPAGHRLDLFVTATDFYGYDRQVALDDPPLVVDRRHRHVLPFAFEAPGPGARGGQDDFGPRANDALAFAARVTSSFPGAFPPVTLAAFARSVGDRPVVPSRLERLFRHYTLAGRDARSAVFIDGGVLDNRPFELAIAAIRERPATLQVDRRLLYVEPDPAGEASAPPDEPPPPIAAVLGAVAGLPRGEPILDNILAVDRLNERVARIRDIVRASFEPIATFLEHELGDDLRTLLAEPDGETMRAINRRVHELARSRAGFGHATYLRTKVSTVVDDVAALTCHICDYPDDSSHGQLVREALRARARSRGLFAARVEPTEEQIAFLDALDLAYRERRIRFTIDGVNRLYGADPATTPPPREELDDCKAKLWSRVVHLVALQQGHGFRGRDLAAAAFPEDAIRRTLRGRRLEPALWADEHADQIDELLGALAAYIRDGLRGFNQSLFAEAFDLSEAWGARHRSALLVRWLGFPIWDGMLFPVQSRSELRELERIRVVRLSPADVRLLPPLGRGPKLAGMRLAHFGAFFDRAGRERDYLWGRLDAAERLVRLVLGAAAAEEDVESWCAEVFRAILAEERADLTKAHDLVEHVEARIGVLAGAPSRT